MTQIGAMLKLREVVSDNKATVAASRPRYKKEHRRYPRPGVSMEAYSYCAAMSSFKIPSL